MTARFLVVPQWQGSGSSRAMRLIDGANEVLGDLPATVTRIVPVPMEAGEALGTGVHRYSSLVATRERIEAELVECDDSVVTLGGDCAADLASVQRAVSSRAAGTTALLWFDAHADLNTADTSTTGSFSGMVLRSLLGDGPDGLRSAGSQLLDPRKVVLAGTRALDDAESAYIGATAIRMLSVDDLETSDHVLDALAETGAAAVYIHVDLDVLDPSVIRGVGYPEPFGVLPERLTSIIRDVRARFGLAGAAICGFAPESLAAAGEDMPVILRIMGALTGPVASTR